MTLAPSAASAQRANDATFQTLLSSPDDPVLNRRFAVEAEARGDVRHALAAIERALAGNPADPALRAEYERLRRKMLPTVTVATVQAGLSFASNPREVGSASPRRRSDGIADAGVALEDERTLGDMRWRSRAVASVQLDRSTSDLNTGRLTVETGPVFSLSKEVWLHIAPGATGVWLDGRRLYDEVSSAATFGTVLNGLTQSVTFRFGWRRGNEEIAVSDSRVFTVEGRLVMSPSLFAGDYFYLQPRYHLSSPLNQPPSSVLMDTVIGFDTAVSRDLSPLAFSEWGARATYLFPLLGGKVFLGAGVAVYDRSYDSFVLDPSALALGVPVATNQKRKDLYVEPTAHVIFPQLLGPKLDFRLDYRFEDNHSNDSYRDFQNHVVGVRVIGRY